MAFHKIEEYANGSSYYWSNGELVSWGVAALEENWGTWVCIGGNVRVNHGGYLETINFMGTNDDGTGEDAAPVGWAVQGKLLVPNGVYDCQVIVTGYFWELEV